MARTIAVIEQQIYDNINANPVLAAIAPNPSQVGIWKVFVNCIAICIGVFEQLIDVFKAQTEATILAAPVGSEPFIQAKVLEFQYDAITPQVLTLVDFSPRYNPIDTTKRIITRAAVTTAPNNTVLVKVAKGSPPGPLSGPELSSLQAYLTGGGDGSYVGRGRGFGFAGQNIFASTADADKLFLRGIIYYNGQYSSVIQQAVIDAINTYLANLPFNGFVTLLALTDAIQSVVGVNDVFLQDVAIRADATAFANKNYLINNGTTSITTYPTFAGYIVEETTSGQGFVNKLTFTPST